MADTNIVNGAPAVLELAAPTTGRESRDAAARARRRADRNCGDVVLWALRVRRPVRRTR